MSEWLDFHFSSRLPRVEKTPGILRHAVRNAGYEIPAKGETARYT